MSAIKGLGSVPPLFTTELWIKLNFFGDLVPMYTIRPSSESLRASSKPVPLPPPKRSIGCLSGNSVSGDVNCSAIISWIVTENAKIVNNHIDLSYGGRKVLDRQAQHKKFIYEAILRRHLPDILLLIPDRIFWNKKICRD